MPRQHFFPQSLSGRVLWLIVSVILLVALVTVIPGMGRERQNWLWDRVTDAQIIALSVRNGPEPLLPQVRNTMLALSDTEAIVLPGASGASGNIEQRPAVSAAEFGADIDIGQESPIESMWRAGVAVLGLEAPYAHVYLTCPRLANARIDVTISQREMARHLRAYLVRVAVIAAILAVVTGSLVFMALDRQLVRPMRIMTDSIAGFRRNPGYAGLGGLKWLSGRGDDEIARTARELAAMQDEMRAAFWRHARLAALGTAVAKISHDLRNILTSALLVADRFHRHEDSTVKHAANTLIPAMEQAVELVNRTVDFAQEGPPAINRSPVVLQQLVNEVADMLRTTDGGVTIDNLVPVSLVLSLDRNQIYRVLVNLLRNAVEAGATRITLTVEVENHMIELVIGDNGPGLPGKVLANLFRPFTGSGRNGGTGLGLAIARDLIRAHGGDLLLRRTGPGGTAFAIALPDPATGDGV